MDGLTVEIDGQVTLISDTIRLMPGVHIKEGSQFYAGSSAPNPPVSEGLYFLHADHLGTTRSITDQSGTVQWRWDAGPFGEIQPDSGPDGDSVPLEFNLRFPGQYFDAETGLYYNYFRYYDPSTGRYITSDPIGLKGGLNTYGYALQNPLKYFDTDGLEVRIICRPLAGVASYTGKQHCFVRVTCPEEGWSATYSLFSTGTNLFGWPNQGAKAQDDPRDDTNSTNNASNSRVDPGACPLQTCGFEKAVRDRFNSFPPGNVPYSPFGPNSNSFAADLATGAPFGGQLPPGVPGPDVAPGIDQPHPNFP